MTAPTRLNFEVQLDNPNYGTSLTAYIDLARSQPIITSELNEQLDTMTLTIYDADAVVPREWQEIYFKHYPPEGLNGYALDFGGYVVTVNQKASINGVGNDYELGCSDFGAIFDKVFYKGEFENKTDAEIIAAVFAASPELSGFYAGSETVQTLKTFPRVRFNRKSVREILDWLCEQTGGHWYAGYSKALYYFGSELTSAPWGVTDDPASTTKHTVEAVTVSKDGSGVVNLVEVVGGTSLSADMVDDDYLLSGIVNYLDLKYRYKPPVGGTKIGVRRNDGGATTNLVVNPSFEVNITDGWTQYQAGAGGVWAQDATKFDKGTKSLKMTSGTAVVVLQGGNITLSAGETLTVQAKMWSPAIGKAAVVIWDVGGAVNRGECYNRKTSQLELVTAGYYNNTGAALTLRVELYNNANDSTTICYYDAIQAEKKTWPTGYCDGSLGAGYSWSGTAHNSTSLRADISVWTTLTVKTGGSEVLEARNEVLYYESISRLEQEAFFPGIVQAVEITGRYETPIRSRIRNQASHDHYGMWLESVISAPEIVDKSIAIMRGKAELARNAFANPAITYTTREPGLRSGMTQHVKLAARGLLSNYLIQRVTTTIGIAGYVISTVDLGAVQKSLVWFLLAMKRKSVPVIEWNDNEVLDEVLDASEVLEMFETVSAPVTSTGPYYYSENSAESFDWGFGAWEE